MVNLNHSFDGPLAFGIHLQVDGEIRHVVQQDEASGFAAALARMETQLAQMTSLLEGIRTDLATHRQREAVVAVQVDALRAEVESIPNTVQAAVTLLNGIVGRLEAMDAAEDAQVQAQIDQLTADIRMNVRPLAEAVAANTPAAEEPAPEPVPTPTTNPTGPTGPTPAPFVGGTQPTGETTGGTGATGGEPAPTGETAGGTGGETGTTAEGERTA